MALPGCWIETLGIQTSRAHCFGGCPNFLAKDRLERGRSQSSILQHPQRRGYRQRGWAGCREKERVGKKVYRCADLSPFPNPPWLAKLACLDAAKVVVTQTHPSCFCHLPAPCSPPSLGWTDKEVSRRKITPGEIKR